MDGGYEVLDRPLFGVSTRRGRLCNLIVGTITSVLVAGTVIMSVISLTSRNCELGANNILFGVCIVVVCISLLILIYWYREGDVDPKFKKLIYFNSASVVMLCICANSYFFSCHKLNSIGNNTVT
ncbi:transmembrane protein 243-like [Styela clava]